MLLSKLMLLSRILCNMYVPFSRKLFATTKVKVKYILVYTS